MALGRANGPRLGRRGWIEVSFLAGILSALLGCGDGDGAVSPAPGPAPSKPQAQVPESDNAGQDEVQPQEVEVHGVRFGPRELRALARLTPLVPPAPDPTNRWADDDAAARLGQRLFFDAGLSVNGQVSCASCHDPQLGFAGEAALSEGIGTGNRHAPSLLGAAYQRWLGWGGRADSLWAQALGPLEHPLEMGSTRLGVLHHVQGTPALREAYQALFGPLPSLEDEARFPARARPPIPDDGDAVLPEHGAWNAMEPGDQNAANRAFANLGKAIAAYERRLVRGDSPFDRFAAALLDRDGSNPKELDSYPAAAARGLSIFLGHGRCVLCHQGPNLSDGEFHNTGVPPGPGGDGDDPGRHRGAALVRAHPFNAASPFSDAPQGQAAERVQGLRLGSETWGEFRTPSLRNLARRAPFMHQGQLADLATVVHFYDTLEGSVGRSHHQELILIPLELGDEGRADLLAFLATLEGAPLAPDLSSAPE